LGKKIKKKGN